MIPFLHPGCGEPVKISVHALSGLLCGAFTIYNAMAYWERRETHNAVNACIYFFGTAGEVYQTSCHFNRKG